MSFTRAQFRVRTMRRMDTNVSVSTLQPGRWDATAGTSGEVDQVMGFVHWREWRRILNANRHYRMNDAVAATTLTTTSSGNIAFSSLNTGSGDSQKIAYRILSLTRANYIYKQGDSEDWTLSETESGSRIWIQRGQTLQLLPVEASITLATSNGDHIWVSWHPQRIDVLSTDTVTVDFPDGYEEIVCLESAALLLSKGGAEAETAVYFKQLAEEMRQDMLQDISRMSTLPTRMRFDDSREEWAG